MAGQAQAFYADGRPIPEGELMAAIQSGAAHYEQGSKVLVRDAEGRAGTVDAAEVGTLLASGGALETTESLAAEEAQKQRAAQTSEKISRAINPLQLGLGYHEAIASGATLGGTDLALTSLLGDEYREGALARRQNPATAIPEIGGAAGAVVASSLLGGAPGAGAGAARVATAGGRLLGAAGGAGEALGVGAAEALGLGRGVGTGLGLLGRGAGEGAIAGLGQEVSAASLEDRDLTVDKLMAAAGHGALMGGALNVATGGATRLLGAAGKAALRGMGDGESLGASILKGGKRLAIKDQFGNAVKYYNEATNFGRNPERLDRIAQKLLDGGITGKNPEAAAGMARERLEQAGQRMRSIADTLDAQGTRVDPRAIVSSVDEQIARLRKSDLSDFDDVADQIANKVSKVRARADAGETYSFSEAWQLRRDIDKVARWAKNNRSPAEEEVVRLRGIVDDILDDATDPIPAKLKARPDMAEQFGRVMRGEVPEQELRFLRNGYRDQSTAYLRKAYEAGLDPSDVAAGRVTPPGFSRPMDPIRIDIFPDNPIPSVGDGRHRLMLAQKNGAKEIRALVNVFDESGDELASIERVIPMPGMPRAEPDLRGAWLAAKEDFADFRLVNDAVGARILRDEKNRFLSPSDHFGGGVGLIAALLSGGSALTGIAASAGAALANKALREKGPGAIARMANAISKFDGRTDKAIAAAIEGRVKDLPDLPKRTVPLLTMLQTPEGQPTLRTASNDRERYEKTLTLVRDMASPTPSPEAAKRLGNATQQLAEDFPELASLLHQRVIAAAQALNARAPVPLQRRNPLQQHLEDQRVPAGLISKWLREVDAADTPEGIWHDMAKGRVPREKIEIVKLTAPHLFQDWRMRVMKYVAAKPEKLSRPQRIRLSLAFDFTGDSTLDPAFISQVQGEYAAEKQQQAQPQAPQPTNISTQQADDMKPSTERSFLQAG
jgi:hypothetical protein